MFLLFFSSFLVYSGLHTVLPPYSSVMNSKRRSPFSYIPSSFCTFTSCLCILESELTTGFDWLVAWTFTKSTVERYTAEIFHEDGGGVCFFFFSFTLFIILYAIGNWGVQTLVYLTASINVVHNKKLHLLLWKPCLQRPLCHRNLEPWFLHIYKHRKENKNENFIL